LHDETSWPDSAARRHGRWRHGRSRAAACCIGWLTSLDEDDSLLKTQVSEFIQSLAGLGWTDGRNVRTDLRWGGGDDINRIRALARELVGAQPDIILVAGTR
jgi:putative ABC transport system substrate-binding protein